MRKITNLDEAKIRILFETGAITQRQLAKVFGCGQENVSRVVVRSRKRECK
jgi:hypothetical protein